MCEQKMIPVKKFTYEIQVESDIIDLSDTKRWGDYVAGGMFQNTGTNDVLIDQTYTLSPGQVMTIGIGWPYADKSSYRVNFVVGARTGTNSLAVTLYRVFPDAAA